jgi:hypothetical protein
VVNSGGGVWQYVVELMLSAILLRVRNPSPTPHIRMGGVSKMPKSVLNSYRYNTYGIVSKVQKAVLAFKGKFRIICP